MVLDATTHEGCTQADHGQRRGQRSRYLSRRIQGGAWLGVLNPER